MTPWIVLACAQKRDMGLLKFKDSKMIFRFVISYSKLDIILLSESILTVFTPQLNGY